jgi:hypothetical protein
VLKSLVFEGLGDGFLSTGVVAVVVVLWKELVDVYSFSFCRKLGMGIVNALKVNGMSNFYITFKFNMKLTSYQRI